MKYIVTYFDGGAQQTVEKAFHRVDDALRFHAERFIENLVPFHGPHPTIKESDLIEFQKLDLSYLEE